MKKVLKVGCLSIVSFFVLILVIGLIFGPPAEDTATLPVEVEQESPSTDHPPSPDPKMLVWDRTPAEQGLKVGDWIIAQGVSGPYIGATAVRLGDRNYGQFDEALLSDIDPQTGKYFIQTSGRLLQVFKLSYDRDGYFDFAEKFPVPPNLKLGLIFINITNPSQSSVIRQYNLLRLHEQDHITDLILSGQISEIHQTSGGDLLFIDIDDLEESNLQLTAPDAEISQAMQQAKETASSVMQKFFQ